MAYNGVLDYWGTNISEDPHDPIVKLVREMALLSCECQTVICDCGVSSSCVCGDIIVRCHPCRARAAILQRKDMVARR